MGDTILLRRGTLANLPDLQDGEPGWVNDKHHLYVGDGTDQFYIGGGVGGQVSFDALASVSEATQVTVSPGSYIISADLTIPSYVSLFVPSGVTITVATTKTLTINGSFEAGIYKVFDCVGTGAVVFGAASVKEVYAEWFQENTNPGTTDMAAGMSAAYSSISKGTMRLLPTSYLTSGQLTAKLGMRIVGYGAGNSDGSAGTTKVTYTGATHWINVALNTPVAAVDIVGMRIHVATGLGAIWVNRTSLAYTDGQHSLRWILKDLVIVHDIPGTVDSVGLSLTQLAVSRIEDVVVSGFATQVIDRNGTVNIFDHVRVSAATEDSVGIHFQGTTTGGLQEYCYGMDVLSYGLDSIGVKLDARNVQFYGLFIESSGSSLPNVLLKVTDAGQSCSLYGVVFSNQIAACPLIHVDASCTYGPTITDGVALSSNYAQIGVGAGSTLKLNNPNENLYNASMTERLAGKINGDILTTTASTATATPVVLFTAQAGYMYIVTAYLSNGGATYHATATVFNDAGATGIYNNVNGGAMTLDLSGNDVRATQSSGVNQVIYFIVKRIPE